MTSSAADTEDFARLLLRTIEQLGSDNWVRYRDALDLTIDANPDHPYVAYLKEKPGRRIGLAAVAERIRGAEFAHLDRRRASDKKNAPVYYRVNRAGASIDLELPFAPPANHPLRLKRRWFEGEVGAPSARYADLTQPSPCRPGGAACAPVGEGPGNPGRERPASPGSPGHASAAPSSACCARSGPLSRAPDSHLATRPSGRRASEQPPQLVPPACRRARS